MPVRNTSADAVLTTQVESEFKRQDPAPFFGILRFNSLAPGRFQINFRQVIFKLTLVNGGWGISYEISLRWMPLCLIVDKSTLVQVMAWCRQATSHYLSQCWPRSMLPNGVTRPQWVKYTGLKLGHHWVSRCPNMLGHQQVQYPLQRHMSPSAILSLAINDFEYIILKMKRHSKWPKSWKISHHVKEITKFYN